MCEEKGEGVKQRRWKGWKRLATTKVLHHSSHHSAIDNVQTV